jgi:hypothetical protein
VKTISNVRNSLLTVHFSISAWEARKQDKKATREVAVTHGTTPTPAATTRICCPVPRSTRRS